MLTLYYKPTCPFSQRVLGEAEVLNLKMNLKDISTDAVALEELLALGGKKQTPFLHDDSDTAERRDDLNLYESTDIISYLIEYQNRQTAAASFGGVRVHQSDETCDTCQ